MGSGLSPKQLQGLMLEKKMVTSQEGKDGQQGPRRETRDSRTPCGPQRTACWEEESSVLRGHRGFEEVTFGNRPYGLGIGGCWQCPLRWREGSGSSQMGARRVGREGRRQGIQGGLAENEKEKWGSDRRRFYGVEGGWYDFFY